MMWWFFDDSVTSFLHSNGIAMTVCSASASSFVLEYALVSYLSYKVNNTKERNYYIISYLKELNNLFNNLRGKYNKNTDTI